ncbi:MAG: DUF3150 domain-containing protein [Thiohalocapsa sp.]
MSNDSNETHSAPAVIRLTDQTTLFLVDYHIWSGRKKLRAEDLKMGTALPPDALISLGSKKICNPDELRVFHRNKKRVERELLAVGTRFLGGYVVPNNRAAEVRAKADAITAETRAAAEAFLADYDGHIDAWCAAYPDWETAIRNAVDPVEVVRGQFRFRVQALQIETSRVIGEDTLAEDLAEVGESIFAEVEQMARGLERSFLGKDGLSRRALGTFRRIYDKLDALSFVDYRIDPVVRSIRGWLDRLPAVGPIEGGLFMEGWALMRLVCDAEAMARHGEGILGLDELMPSPGADAPEAPKPEQEESTPPIAAEVRGLAQPPEQVTDFDDLFDDALSALPPDSAVESPEASEAAAEAEREELVREAPTPATQPTEPAVPASTQDFWF